MENQKKIIPLPELRDRIDAIDRELVSLFCRRMEVSAAVADYKRANHMPVTDAARERALLGKVSDLAGEQMEDYTRTLYATILSLSRAYQHEMCDSSTDLVRLIEDTVKNTAPIFPARATVACQGVEGAYSQQAAVRLFECPDIHYYGQFADVFNAIERGECRYGVLPIENSTAGSVTKIYDLMQSHRFYIVRALRLKVDHDLLVKRGMKLENIKEIVSHEQAISQCSEFLAKHPHIKVTEFPNTAAAARYAAESDGTVAALASHICTEIYDLEAVCRSVQNNGNNYTRFICISKKPEIYPGANKTSITLFVPHKPGALSRMLARFDALHINLTKLESRPVPGQDFQFMFYFDLEAPMAAPSLPRLLCELEAQSEDFRYLGSYSEIL